MAYNQPRGWSRSREREGGEGGGRGRSAILSARVAAMRTPSHISPSEPVLHLSSLLIEFAPPRKHPSRLCRDLFSLSPPSPEGRREDARMNGERAHTSSCDNSRRQFPSDDIQPTYRNESAASACLRLPRLYRGSGMKTEESGDVSQVKTLSRPLSLFFVYTHTHTHSLSLSLALFSRRSSFRPL